MSETSGRCRGFVLRDRPSPTALSSHAANHREVENARFGVGWGATGQSLLSKEPSDCAGKTRTPGELRVSRVKLSARN